MPVDGRLAPQQVEGLVRDALRPRVLQQVDLVESHQVSPRGAGSGTAATGGRVTRARRAGGRGRAGAAPGDRTLGVRRLAAEEAAQRGDHRRLADGVGDQPVDHLEPEQRADEHRGRLQRRRQRGDEALVGPLVECDGEGCALGPVPAAQAGGGVGVARAVGPDPHLVLELHPVAGRGRRVGEVPPQRGQALVERGGGLDVGEHGLGHQVERLVEQLDEEAVLAAELAVERPRRALGPLGDGVDRGPLDPLLGDDRRGRGEQAGPGLDAAGLAGPGHAGEHRHEP